jgi:FSR family fosmidomycin resistance protein-like MFS transporter
MAIFDLFALRGTEPKTQISFQLSEAETKERPKLVLWALIVFALLAAFQSWSAQNLTTYLPKYLSDLGATPSQYGALAAAMMAGSAAGNVIGGNLGDRYGKRYVVTIFLSLAALPIVGISVLGWSPWLFLVAPLAGAFVGANHSIIVVLAQRLIPSGMGLASGLVLGFMFAAGSLGAFLSGWLADLWGFPVMFGLTAGLVLLAAGLARSLGQVELEV